MAEIKDYSKEFVETEQGLVPVDTVLGLLRYYYQEDILLALYEYAFEHQDDYISSQIRAFRRRRLHSRKGGPVASQRNLSRTATTKKPDTNDTLEINYFAPTKILKELLREAWFKEVRTMTEFDELWTDSFVNALMSTEWKDEIAIDWAIKGKRNKRTQIKGYIVGLLADAGVIKGSYDSIAMKVGATEEPRSFSRYMGQGKQQSFAQWVMEYVKV